MNGRQAKRLRRLGERKKHVPMNERQYEGGMPEEVETTGLMKYRKHLEDLGFKLKRKKMSNWHKDETTGKIYRRTPIRRVK